jgi:hypothetical protein
MDRRFVRASASNVKYSAAFRECSFYLVCLRLGLQPSSRRLDRNDNGNVVGEFCDVFERQVEVGRDQGRPAIDAIDAAAAPVALINNSRRQTLQEPQPYERKRD